MGVKGGGGERRTEVGVGGRPTSAQERGKQTGKAGPGSGRQEEGRAGKQAGKLLGPLVGDVQGYGTDRRRREGGTGANPFRDLQYSKMVRTAGRNQR